jgi:hypothetical protein
MCVRILLHMCPYTAIYMSSYYYTCVLILLHMCPHTTLCVRILEYIQRPHTTTYTHRCARWTRRMRTYADVRWRTLTYGDVRWRMRMYADVSDVRWRSCWRMLTYAGVCWRMLLQVRTCINDKHTLPGQYVGLILNAYSRTGVASPHLFRTLSAGVSMSVSMYTKRLLANWRRELASRARIPSAPCQQVYLYLYQCILNAYSRTGVANPHLFRTLSTGVSISVSIYISVCYTFICFICSIYVYYVYVYIYLSDAC